MNIFITGTDTDVGKTIVTAGIATALRSRGYSVGVFKPIQTGSVEKNGILVSPDIEFVKSVDSGILTKVSYLFKEPVAPSLAAETEGTAINPAVILRDYEEIKNKCDFVIVEGAGGLLVPIKDNFFMRDLVKLLDLPLIVVSKPDLGTINHTLLTLEAAKNKNIKIEGIIISNYPENTEDLAIKNAPRIIKEFSGEKIIGILPHIKNIENNPGILKEVILRHSDLSFFGLNP